MKGLRFRELLRGSDDPNEGISLTLWDSREDLEEYERGSTYQGFLDRVKDFYVGEFGVFASGPCSAIQSEVVSADKDQAVEQRLRCAASR